MRTRPHVPRTGRKRSIKSMIKKKKLGKKNPRQLAASVGRKRVRKTRRR